MFEHKVYRLRVAFHLRKARLYRHRAGRFPVERGDKYFAQLDIVLAGFWRGLAAKDFADSYKYF
jgi:hypothetical protein